ncbi:MAG: hypothetical protein ACLP5H_29305 [Desulfomonilaceae bacterium]
MQELYGLVHGKTTVLTLSLNPQTHYGLPDLTTAVNLLAPFPGLKVFVIQDGNGRVLGFVPFETMRGIVRYPKPSVPLWLIESINNGVVEEINKFPGVVTTVVTDATTTVATLDKMTSENLPIIAVVDKEGRLKSVVSREQLISEIVLAVGK